jgi:Protein of unknown function (DUF1269)
MLIGLIFLMPLVGTALGAASGALGGALSDTGIDDDFMKDAAQALIPGSAGLFLLIRKMTTDKVLADLEGVGGTVLRTSFDHTNEQALRDALAGHAATEQTAQPAPRAAGRGGSSTPNGKGAGVAPFPLRHGRALPYDDRSSGQRARRLACLLSSAAAPPDRASAWTRLIPIAATRSLRLPSRRPTPIIRQQPLRFCVALRIAM